MTTGRSDSYVFENGRFLPLPEPNPTETDWSMPLEEQGYTASARVWGEYPHIYIKIYEARSNGSTQFPFAALLKLASFPHHVFARDLNDLVQLLRLIQPLVIQPSQPAEDEADALYGTQGADEQPTDEVSSEK